MASDNQPSFTVSRDSNGRVDEIRDAQDALVPKDPHDQRYCDFLTWASHYEPEIDRQQFSLPGSSCFFSSVESLTDHCRAGGITLASGDACFPRGKTRAADESLGKELLVDDFPWRDSRQSENFYNLLLVGALLPSEVGGEDGLAMAPSNIWVTNALHNELNRQVKSDDSDVRRLSSWPRERSFVTLDISDYSEYPTGQQLLIIKSLIQLVKTRRYWNFRSVVDFQQSYEDALCTGDGYVYVFKDVLEAALFAAHLAKLIEVKGAKGQLPVPFHFRVGLHHGPVYSFCDPGRKDWNYSGSGINGSRRVLEAVGKDRDDMVFVSGEFKDELVRANDGGREFEKIRATLQNRGRHRDKHGNPWRVYELNHTAVATLPADLDQ